MRDEDGAPTTPPRHPRDVWVCGLRATLLTLLGTPSEASPYFWLSPLGRWVACVFGPRLSCVARSKTWIFSFVAAWRDGAPLFEPQGGTPDAWRASR
jgi:hypothetical protein